MSRSCCISTKDRSSDTSSANWNVWVSHGRIGLSIRVPSACLNADSAYSYWHRGNSIPTLKGGSTVGIPSSPAIWMPDGNIVTPEIRDAERLQGFEADWTKPAEKVKRPSYRWKLLGNAVGVPVSKWLGKMLEARSEWDPPKDSQRFEDEGPCPSAAFGSRHTGRFRADVSAFPVRYTRVPLSEFLRYEPKPLSAKATEGFINRLVRGTLRYPEEFKRALNDHLLRQGGLVSEPLVQ